MLCRRRQRSCDYVSQRGLRIGFNIKSGSARSGERTKELEEEWLKTQKIEENKMSWSKSPQCTHTLRREQIRLAKINYRRTSVAITKKKERKGRRKRSLGRKGLGSEHKALWRWRWRCERKTEETRERKEARSNCFYPWLGLSATPPSIRVPWYTCLVLLYLRSIPFTCHPLSLTFAASCKG